MCVFPPPTDGSLLFLYFYYLMNLNIMTVKTKVSVPTDLSSTISAGCVCVSFSLCPYVAKWNVCNSVCVFRDLLKSDTLLSCLYAGDHGGETPNPANRYQFDKVG